MIETADAVIIGGGSTGTSIAFHLAGRGARRVVCAFRRPADFGRAPMVYEEVFTRLGLTAVNATIAVWENVRQTIDEIARWHEKLDRLGHLIMPVHTAEDIPRAKREGKVGIIWGFQNSAPIVAIGADSTEKQSDAFFRHLLTGKLPTRESMPLDLPIVNPLGIRSATEFPNLTAGLLERGYAEGDVRKIMGEDWLRLYRKVWR